MAGAARPKCAYAERVATRPRAVRIKKPCWMRKGSIDILDGAALLAHGRGQAIDPHRPALEFLNDRQQQFSVEHVEAFRIDFQHVERGESHFRR